MTQGGPKITTVLSDLNPPEILSYKTSLCYVKILFQTAQRGMKKIMPFWRPCHAHEGDGSNACRSHFTFWPTNQAAACVERTWLTQKDSDSVPKGLTTHQYAYVECCFYTAYASHSAYCGSAYKPTSLNTHLHVYADYGNFWLWPIYNMYTHMHTMCVHVCLSQILHIADMITCRVCLSVFACLHAYSLSLSKKTFCCHALVYSGVRLL